MKTAGNCVRTLHCICFGRPISSLIIFKNLRLDICIYIIYHHQLFLH